MEEMKEKKPGFFEGLHMSKKKQFFFVLASMFVLIATYIPVMLMVKNFNIKNKEEVIDFNLLAGVDGIDNKKEITISGWILRSSSKNVEAQLILKSEDSGDELLCNTELNENNVIANEIDKNWDFGKEGFTAKIKEKKIQKKIVYKIFLYLKYKENNVSKSSKIDTGYYFYNGELYSQNPLVFETPHIQDDVISNVISEGKVLFHSSENGCWLYQYGNELYLIVNNLFGLTEDGRRRVKFHTHTIYNELLPENRQQYGYESRDFFFEEKEYQLLDDEKYRVAIIEMPLSYRLSYLELGLYEPSIVMVNDMAFQVYKK